MKIYLFIFFTIFSFQVTIAQDVTDSIPNDTIYKFVEQMPVFENCTDLLGEDERNACTHNQLMLYVLRKLPMAENISVENIKVGEVMVRFVVDENGDIQNARLITGINKEFDKVYLEIFKSMPQWKAGYKDGKPVKVEKTLSMKVHF